MMKSYQDYLTQGGALGTFPAGENFEQFHEGSLAQLGRTAGWAKIRSLKNQIKREKDPVKKMDLLTDQIELLALLSFTNRSAGK